MGGRVRVWAAAIAIAFASATAFAPAARAQGKLAPSPHLVSIPDPPCDLVITMANAVTTLALLDSPAYRVFCVSPGDYRLLGGISLDSSGSESSPRYLRFHGPGSVKAFQRAQQAWVERITVRGSWWVIQGLTIQPHSAGTQYFVRLYGADHVVVDGNLLDGVEHPNGSRQNGVWIGGRYGDPATYNTVQRNVIRNGDQSLLAGDYVAVQIRGADAPGENNDRNRVLDNEIADWGDGVALTGSSDACDDPGAAHGTLIDGNDIYLTPAKYVDCQTGAFDPAGQCACAESAVDVKARPSPAPADWTRVTRNRMWGYRPTTEALVCGGTGALGQAVTAGNTCPRYVVVAKNAIADSTIGIDVAGEGWLVAGNLIHDIQPSDGRIYGTYGLLLTAEATGVAVQWNTIVSALNAYDDRSSDTDTRCNAVIESPEWIGWGHPRGANHVTEYNFLYAAGWSNLTGPTNQIFSNALQSANQPLCYERRRWSGVETVCVPYGATTGSSPHRAAEPHCDAAIAAPFGLPTVGYWTKPAPSLACGLGAEVALVLGALAACARRGRAAERSLEL